MWNWNSDHWFSPTIMGCTLNQVNIRLGYWVIIQRRKPTFLNKGNTDGTRPMPFSYILRLQRREEKRSKTQFLSYGSKEINRTLQSMRDAAGWRTK